MNKTVNLNGIDSIIHEKVRLGIMSILMVHNEAEFTYLKEMLELTSGNLNAHLKVLEDNGYIRVKKEFVGRKPRTTYQLTSKGKKMFKKYVSALKKIISARER
ncbi:MAG: winged helix-turn-helix domain-containing protein [Candidatus Aminicenantia bacterium]